jgi:hypothetical protein
VALARGWPELEAGWVHAGSKAVARSQECYGGGKATGVEAKVRRGRRKGNGVNPDMGRPIYSRVHRIYPLRFLPRYNMLQWLYSEKFARRLR